MNLITKINQTPVSQLPKLYEKELFKARKIFTASIRVKKINKLNRIFQKVMI
jgi:hypothetical protein